MFDIDADQDLFVTTTERFLASRYPIAAVRAAATSEHGYESDYWRQGAELGWTSLMVPEAAGGGSISGRGALDLVLVASTFGRLAAPGPLGPTNVVAAALGRWGSARQQEGPLTALLAGESVGAWAVAEPPPSDRLGAITATVAVDGDTIELNGVKSPVEAGGSADVLLVTASNGDGIRHLLVPVDAPGVTIVPLESIETTRRYVEIRFDGMRLPAEHLLAADDSSLEWLLDLGVLIQLGEMVGAMQWAFDTTIEWALNRFSFGRPLAAYQEIKHRFADMKTWLEASYAIVGDAAIAFSDGDPLASQLVSAGKFYVGRQAGELLQDCVQMHGGIGVTSEHDLHLFLRRVAADSSMLGAPHEHAARLTQLLELEGAGR